MQKSVAVSKVVLIGWAIELLGTAIWLYGWLTTGHPSFIRWHDFSPWWIADCLPNIESEIGMAMMIIGLVPIYWPRSNNSISGARS